MNSSDIIKDIRSRLGLSQAELAGRLGISFATVNRWENGRCEPSQIAGKAIRRLCADNGIDFPRCENNAVISSEETVTLYHGSKSGIINSITPISRDKCDFGKGFYMGTERSQPLTLICNYDKAKFYTLRVSLKGLKVLDIAIGIDWAMLIAYNRGRMETLRDTSVYRRVSELTKDVDMAVGYIADDRMFVVLDRFFNGEITDTALINSLSALKLGKQYVALTQKACDQIEIVSEETLTEENRERLKTESELNRAKGIALANEICLRYRRDGSFFDELLKAEESKQHTVQ